MVDTQPGIRSFIRVRLFRLRRGRAAWWLLLRWMMAAGAVGAAEPGASTDPVAGAVEHWYSIDVDGQNAGWSLAREIRRGDRLVSVSIANLRFRRSGVEQTLGIESRFVETSDGEPVSAWSRQGFGAQPMETTWTFLQGAVLVETTRGGNAHQQRVPRPPDGWLTPGRLQARLRQLLASGEESFVLSSVDPQLGLEIVDTEWILEGPAGEALVDGEARPTRRFRQRQSFAPQLASVVDVTVDGVVVRSVTPMMGLTTTETLTTREAALAGGGAPDLLLSSFVYPDRPIPEPRRARRALYEITTGDGEPVDLPSAGDQRTVSTPAGRRVLVEVGSSPLLRGADLPDDAPYLRASMFLDHTDPDVRRLLRLALGDASPEPRRRAETLRAFVAGYVRDKNLDSILATAGEVADTRAGDCTEHSVLLTALLRAADIPARVVTGLVYVEEFAGESRLFAYHMWSQALIEDRWIDLDATFEEPFDAAHVAIGATALNDDQATLPELAKLAALMGNARIRVLEVTQ